jgi:hypothetical protein
VPPHAGPAASVAGAPWTTPPVPPPREEPASRPLPLIAREEELAASGVRGEERGGEECGRKKEDKHDDMWGPLDIELSLRRLFD